MLVSNKRFPSHVGTRQSLNFVTAIREHSDNRCGTGLAAGVPSTAQHSRFGWLPVGGASAAFWLPCKGTYVRAVYKIRSQPPGQIWLIKYGLSCESSVFN